MMRLAAGALAATLVLLAAAAANAQGSALPPDIGPGRPMRRGVSAPPPRPLPPTQPTAGVWPHLDPGAVLCRTSEDLGRHTAREAARAEGEATLPPAPVGCRVIRSPTGVAVLARPGPGRTQVRLDGEAAETGWTNVYLPDRSTR
jgi:hypothetical protein